MLVTSWNKLLLEDFIQKKKRIQNDKPKTQQTIIQHMCIVMLLLYIENYKTRKKTHKFRYVFDIINIIPTTLPIQLS